MSYSNVSISMFTIYYDAHMKLLMNIVTLLSNFQLNKTGVEPDFLGGWVAKYPREKIRGAQNRLIR